MSVVLMVGAAWLVIGLVVACFFALVGRGGLREEADRGRLPHSSGSRADGVQALVPAPLGTDQGEEELGPRE